jgi:hypothetical protein
MPEKLKNCEKESFLGLSTLELAKRIVDSNSEIKAVGLKPYVYVPNKPSGNETVYSFPRSSFFNTKQEDLNNWCACLGEGYNIALCSSLVLKDGSRGHLIMADLAPSRSDESLAKVKRRFKEIVQDEFGGGFFLETKRSYQFLGENTVSQNNWNNLLGTLLTTEIIAYFGAEIPAEHERIVDTKYVGYSLKRGHMGLRLTTNGAKTVVPRVVGFI